MSNKRIPMKNMVKKYDIFMINVSKRYNIQKYMFKLHLVIWNMIIANIKKYNVTKNRVKKIFRKVSDMIMNGTQKCCLLAHYVSKCSISASDMFINNGRKYDVIMEKCNAVLYSLIRKYNMIMIWKCYLKLVNCLLSDYNKIFYVFVKLNFLILDGALLCF